MGKLNVLIAWLFFFCSFCSFADDFRVPELTGPVVDEAQILSEEDKSRLSGMLLKLQQSGKIQMAIYLPASLHEFDIESFSMKVAEAWKLGQKGIDEGLLLVVAPRERKMRFEVGYGLEGDLTDAYTRRVLDSLRAYFRNQRYADGLMVAVEQVAQRLKIDDTAPVESRLPEEINDQGAPLPIGFVLVGFLFLFVFLFSAFLGNRRSSRYHRGGDWFGGGGFGGGGFGGGGFGGGGFGGGGGFSGGGGGFGGGGSSSSW